MIDKAIETLRDAIKVYPNNYGFLSELAIALTLKYNTNSEYAILNEAIGLCERILLNSTSEKLRSTTKANLCFLYLKANKSDKAIKLVKTLPHVWECREMLLPEMLNESDYVSELKKGIITVISVICEKIQTSKNQDLSRSGKLIAIGPNTNFNKDDWKEKIDLITQFLM